MPVQGGGLEIKMKIAYIGIDLFYDALSSLYECGCEIAEIFTCETDNVSEFNVKILNFAKQHNIPHTTNRITAADIERLMNNGTYAAVCGGYYYKIPVIEGFRAVNIHPSLLPEGRGSWPMPQTILWGLKESGVTVHKIAEGFDTGDILLQKRFPVSADETLETFMNKACALLPDMMRKLTENFFDLWENASPQQGGSYWAAPCEADWTVRFDMPLSEADRILRAFYGYETVYIAENGEKFRMLRAAADEKCGQFPLKGGFVSAKKLL